MSRRPAQRNQNIQEESRVLFLAREDLLRFIETHPQVALNALRMMAGKLRSVASMVEQLALMDVNQRLAGLLLDEARKTTPRLEDGASFLLSLSHAQIAARLGSVRGVVTRHLQKFAQLGLIEVHGRRVIVLNARALLAQAGSKIQFRAEPEPGKERR